MSSERRKYELKARAERQAATRERIVAATMDLHQEVGPARTTVAEIARRAGVQRVTVYNHFPQDTELFAACQGHFLAANPPPDPAPAMEIADPRERLQAVLELFYSRYRATEPMSTAVQRDRTLVPALDALLAETMDVQLGGLADALSAGLDGGKHTRAMVALSLDFWTWRRLASEGLDDAAAAGAMAAAAAGRCPGSPGEDGIRPA